MSVKKKKLIYFFFWSHGLCKYNFALCKYNFARSLRKVPWIWLDCNIFWIINVKSIKPNYVKFGIILCSPSIYCPLHGNNPSSPRLGKYIDEDYCAMTMLPLGKMSSCAWGWDPSSELRVSHLGKRRELGKQSLD